MRNTLQLHFITSNIYAEGPRMDSLSQVTSLKHMGENVERVVLFLVF